MGSADDDGHPEHTELVACWLGDKVLAIKAESGIMSNTVKKNAAKRCDVLANYETLVPVIRILGPKVQIDTLQEHCREFLWKTRPRGKPELSRTSGLFGKFLFGSYNIGSTALIIIAVPASLGNHVRREAWKLRRMLSAFSRIAKRPHWPREHGMRRLFEAAGMEQPKGAWLLLALLQVLHP